MSRSDRTLNLDALLRTGRLSRRDLLYAAAGLGLAGLAASAGLRAQPLPRFVADPFTLGVASGDPRADGATLWTRLAPMPLRPDGGIDRDEWVVVDWQVAEDEAFSKVVRAGRVRAVGELAHSVHVDVDGLAPDRIYHYRFIAGDAVSPSGRTRTAPAPGAARRQLRFAFSSCQHYEQGWFVGYDGILADDVDLMVFLGDYIYESSWGDDLVRRHMGGEPYVLDDYRVRHAQYKLDPSLQRAHAALPWLLTWDDHEVDNDPSASESEHLDPRFLLRRAAAYQAYWEHMPLPRALRPRTDGSMPIHRRVDFGEMASFFVLDTRQHRDPMACPDPLKGGGGTRVEAASCEALADPSRSLLGAAQEAWLLDGLASSRSHWNIIAQQTLFSPRTFEEGPRRIATDGWDGYPASQARLIEALARPGLSNPMLIGGDIHASVVADVKADPWRPTATVAAEVCATSMSSQGRPQEQFDAQARLNPHWKFARSDRRGYALATLGGAGADVALRSPQSVKTRQSAVETLAGFVVEDGVRGIRQV